MKKSTILQFSMLYLGLNSALAQEATESAKESVDLGLSVKWATCNVGANKPTEKGSYFAWGETSEKKDYTWKTYSLCDEGEDYHQNKYVTLKFYGKVDNRSVLEPEDDAATVKWGAEWRTPTKEEFNELQEKCTWTWTPNYDSTGVNGYVITSMVEGFTDKSIFLPAAGTRNKNYVDDQDDFCIYWTSTLGTWSNSIAIGLGFSSESYDQYDYDRFYGNCVRPVHR